MVENEHQPESVRSQKVPTLDLRQAAFGSEPDILPWAFGIWTHMKRNRTTLCHSIHHQFINKNGDHNGSQHPDYETVSFGCDARPLTDPTDLRRDTSDDQYHASCLRFAVVMDTCPASTTEQVVVFHYLRQSGVLGKAHLQDLVKLMYATEPFKPLA
jgi:hypothetical protein